MAYTVARGDTLSGIARKLGVSLSALEKANPQIKNFNVITPGMTINTVGAPAPAAAPPALDMSAAMNQFGIVAQIVQGIPELRSVLQDAVSKGLSPDAFNAQIAASPWFQQHSDSLRNLLLQQASDPATFQRNLTQAQNLVEQTAGQMGRAVNAADYAYQYIANGWNQQQLQWMIATQGFSNEANGAHAGEAGKLQASLKQTAEDYGVPFTDQFIDDYVNKIQLGQDTADGFDNLMKARAKAAYPGYAAQIDQGMTMTQIADPYAAQMAKTLELPQTAVKWQSDPLIQKALQAADPTTGQPTGQPLWQFNQQLKNDPRYDYTQQAKTDAYSTLAEIGKSWGFYA